MNGDSILQEWYDAIKSADSIDKIEEIRIAVFGKKGIMNAEFTRMKDIPDAEKGTFAKELNIHKEGLNALLVDRKLFLAMEHLQATMRAEAIDVSLYSATTEHGSLHPVMETMDRIVEYFVAMNFSVQTGPMVEDDF
ncbi:MAG TPA: phenylalanine--tRNA ligase subunit alpha, partial [Sulfuricurvum kujiense]